MWPYRQGPGVERPSVSRVDLDRATTAHRKALADLEAARAKAAVLVESAREAVAKTRADLAGAIVEAANQGVPQVDIIRATGYARESVRRILRDGGVEPDQ